MRFGGDQPYGPADIPLPPAHERGPRCHDCGDPTIDHIGPGTLNMDCDCCSWRKAERVPSRVQARDEPCADPASCDLPGHDHPAATPRVPPWVRDPVKWASLSRRERRALERHHRKVNRNG